MAALQSPKTRRWCLTLTLLGGAVTTGAGILTLTGNLTANGSPISSSISGNLNFGGTTRTLTVNDGLARDDLLISAAITNGGLIKAGNGLPT